MNEFSPRRSVTAASPELNSYGADPEATIDQEQSLFSLDLREVLSAIKRNRIWIALVIAVALAAGLLISTLMVPRYISTAQVLVEQQADQIIEGSDLGPAASYQDADRFLQTQLDIVRSGDMARRVVAAEGLADNPEFFDAMGEAMPVQEDFDEMINRPASLEDLRTEVATQLLLLSLSASLPVDSRLISIGIETVSPQWSAKLANAYARSFISGNLARKFDSSAYARDFLAQQLQGARQELEESERQLNQYSRVAGLIRVQGQGEDGTRENTLSVTTNSLVQINAAASQATADRVAAENRWTAIANVPVLSIPQVLSNSAMQALIRQRSELEAQLAQQQARYLADHPNVQAVSAQVDEVNREIQNLGQSLKRSVQLEYTAAREREEALQARVQGLQSNALEEQDRGVRFNVLQREAETKRALYDTLLARYNELNAASGSTSNNISLVDEASVPRKPSSPNLPLNMILALFAGIGLAGGFVFLREYFDDTIRAPSDVETKLGLPLLGLIPLSDEGPMEAQLLDPKSPVSEAYASLLTNLRFSTTHGIPELLILTSAQQSEGKSTSSTALAQDLAEFGKRVLLIDADMRRPTLHKMHDEALDVGLASYLAGEKEIDDIIAQSKTPNLDLVSALPMPPDPPILLNGNRLDRLFAEARERYDCVLVDCPPMLGLSDTAILASHSDAVLMIVDALAGHRGAVKTALRRLRLINAPVLGAVLTKFDPRGANDEYSYSYYSYGER